MPMHPTRTAPASPPSAGRVQNVLETLMNWGPPKPKILESAIEQTDRIEIGAASAAPHRAEAAAIPATPVRAKPETRVAARPDEAHAATQATGKAVAQVAAATAVRDTPASEPSPLQPVPAPERPPSPMESWAREISGAAARTATAAGEVIKARLSFERTSQSKAAADARPAAEDAHAKAQIKTAGVRWDTPPEGYRCPRDRGNTGRSRGQFQFSSVALPLHPTNGRAASALAHPSVQVDRAGVPRFGVLHRRGRARWDRERAHAARLLRRVLHRRERDDGHRPRSISPPSTGAARSSLRC
jgi:hypothetical protein